MSYNLGTAQGDIRITYDNNGVARARNSLGQFVSASALAGRAMDENEKKSRKLSISLGLLGKAFFLMTKYVTITSAAVQSAITSFNILIAVAQALAPIIAATLATLPGIILSLISSLAVLKAAFIGVGDALKAAVSGDAEKLDEALKKLAPSARAFVLAIQDATKKLRPLQQAIQQAFFSGLAQQIPAIVSALGQTQTQAVRLSTAFNGVTKQLAGFLQTPAFILAVQAALNGVANILNILAPTIIPVLTGFAQMARNAAELATLFRANLAPAAEGLGKSLAGFDIAQAFKDGLAAIQPLINIVKDLGIIIHSVFTDLSAFSASGNQVLGTLGSILDVVAKFVQTDAASAAFQALGQAFSAVAGAAGDIVLSLLQALAPAVAAIAPLFTVLARVLGNLLTSAIATLAPILLQLVEALNGALGPILPEIGAAIGDVVNALGPLLTLIASNLSPLLIALAPIVRQLAQSLAVALTSAIQQLIPPLQDLLPVIVQMVQEVGPSLVQLLAAWAKGFAAAAPLMLLLVNLAVGGLVPVLKILIPIISAVVSVVATLATWLANIIAPIGSFIGKWTEATKISELIQKVFRIVVDAVVSSIATIRASVGAGIGAMMSAFGTLAAIPGQIGGYFAQLRNAISAQLSNAVNTVRALPGQIAGAIGNLGGLLYGAGQDLIQGLVNGIRSMAGRAADAARAAVAGIPGQIKSLLGIASPSKVAMALGREVPRGLALGILDTADLIRAATERAASQVSFAFPKNISASVASAVTASTGASTLGSIPASAAVPTSVSGPTVNTVVNAPQNMNPAEVAQATASKILFALNARG